MKSLNKKVKFVYIVLIFNIFLIGVVTSISVYKAKDSMEKSMSNTYTSLSSINSMISNINSQEKAILIYLQGNREEAINILQDQDDDFYKWLYVAKEHAIDNKEEQLIQKVNDEYIELRKSFSKLQDYNNGNNYNELLEYYIENISNQIEVVIEDLKDIGRINKDFMIIEKGLFDRKITELIYCIISISLLGAVVATITCFTLVNKYFYIINLLLNSFNDTILILDKNYKVKFINKNAEILFELERKVCRNKHILEIINIPDIYNFIQENKFNKSNNNILKINYNDRNLILEIDIAEIGNKSKKSKGVVLIIKDITKIREAEIESRNMVGTISHELKTPLTSLMMGVGLISNKSIGELNEKQRIILDAIGEDVQSLNELVSKLLTTYERQNTSKNINISSCNINKILKHVFTSFKAKAEEKKIFLSLAINNELPNVMIDGEKIRWVLNNLISNAIRYTEKGRVDISGNYNEKDIIITVRDTGRGIPANYLKKVFERFVRVEGFEVPEESTGLGLAIAKEIVELHGGEIWCESKMGVGSIFIFTIPLNYQGKEELRYEKGVSS
ncbi:MAG: PAS domain-containing protein [Clostridium sp.]|nr:PAS domain-containing protein [Clostridium sp.]